MAVPKGARRRTKIVPGLSPGTLTDQVAGVRRVRLRVYDEHGVETRDDPDEATCGAFRARGGRIWLDVAGVPDAGLLRMLGAAFGLHRLALEDVQRAGAQRPKVDSYDGVLFAVLNDVERQASGLLEIEQVSLFLGPSFVVSFHDGEGDDIFAPVARRLDSADNPMRGRGSDYLFYALVDLVIDRKFPLLEDFGDRLDALEAEVLERATPDSARAIQQARRSLHVLRRAIWPERDVVANLLRDDNALIRPETRVYLRDCYDHAAQVIEVLETYRETASGLMDIYVSAISNRLNDIMRLLTVIATIFMPLSFLASVYGMNFDRDAGPLAMPELGWAYGYPAIWCVFITVAIGMIVWFRRRGFF
ncbi:magnesium transporter [Stella humosa]|uniref:Magnesium transport protein CorA n=1 Tax=Stella humosa TaxID=94 RepID=A0A3N1ME75_9PROT|nr:magnesium/cobalt transporter CorA [Stella humosa]ROQ01425.1 magnesium transporter [Stella humosa]BBK31801.1 magnesium transport protein CorA [Stella humosa]